EIRRNSFWSKNDREPFNAAIEAGNQRLRERKIAEWPRLEIEARRLIEEGRHLDAERLLNDYIRALKSDSLVKPTQRDLANLLELAYAQIMMINIHLIKKDPENARMTVDDFNWRFGNKPELLRQLAG